MTIDEIREQKQIAIERIEEAAEKFHRETGLRLVSVSGTLLPDRTTGKPRLFAGVEVEGI